MIIYDKGTFGFTDLTKIHGSAASKAVVPALVSTTILVLVVYAFGLPLEDNDLRRVTRHPYAIQVLVAIFTFLITFRANFAYQRYWEACTAVYTMISKWLDAGMNIAAHHYQSEVYEKQRPPSFGKYAKEQYELYRQNRLDLSRFRKRLAQYTSANEYRIILEKKMQEANSNNNSSKRRWNFLARLWEQKEAPTSDLASIRDQPLKSISSIQYIETNDADSAGVWRGHDQSEADGGVAFTRFSDGTTSPDASARDEIGGSVRSIARLDGGVDRVPSMLLQELAHLFSLLSAVAMSTLRNDIEGTESPLVEYVQGQPWPPIDPSRLSKERRQQYNESSPFWTALYHILGFTRSDRHRTLYNAARPFHVLGGVSDEEAAMLQNARGPYAKTALCFKWVQEFVTREHMHGGTGPMHPAIISRVHQMSSDGMRGYNDARKVAYIPFPFPHAQLTVAFVIVIVFVFPLLFWSYVNNVVLACVLNFSTVMCFVGLHEVARELEAPFFNVPNDLPLTTFQAQFNEALITMYCGYHPDSWWQILEPASNPTSPGTEVASLGIAPTQQPAIGLKKPPATTIEIQDKPPKS